MSWRHRYKFKCHGGIGVSVGVMGGIGVSVGVVGGIGVSVGVMEASV